MKPSLPTHPVMHSFNNTGKADQRWGLGGGGYHSGATPSQNAPAERKNKHLALATRGLTSTL